VNVINMEDSSKSNQLSFHQLVGYFHCTINKIVSNNASVATLVLGSRPKQGLTRVRVKKEAQGSHLMFLGVQKNVKE